MTTESKSMLSDKLSGGPKGLGDPDDRSLRKVEKQVLIPQIMREIMKKEKCAKLTEAFSQCAKKHGLLVVVNCRDENKAMQACLKSWYDNEEFRAECTEEYLRRRSEYRRTGIGKKLREVKQHN